MRHKNQEPSSSHSYVVGCDLAILFCPIDFHVDLSDCTSYSLYVSDPAGLVRLQPSSTLRCISSSLDAMWHMTPARRTSGYCEPYVHVIVLDFVASSNDLRLASWYRPHIQSTNFIRNKIKNSRANLFMHHYFYLFFYLLLIDFSQETRVTIWKQLSHRKFVLFCVPHTRPTCLFFLNQNLLHCAAWAYSSCATLLREMVWNATVLAEISPM
jgi:hypothetical protein